MRNQSTFEHVHQCLARSAESFFPSRAPFFILSFDYSNIQTYHNLFLYKLFHSLAELNLSVSLNFKLSTFKTMMFSSSCSRFMLRKVATRVYERNTLKAISARAFTSSQLCPKADSTTVSLQHPFLCPIE